MSSIKIETVDKVIHYYQLDFKFHEDLKPADGDLFREFFQIIVALAKTRHPMRYQRFGEKAIFIQDIKFDPLAKQIIGKLRCVRTDILPEIMNTNTDEAKGLDAKAEEGLVETTHFIVNYSKKEKKLAIEFNQFGAKINDFVAYLQIIGQANSALHTVGYVPIVKHELASYKSRINRTSELVVKIHKDNIEKIKGLDKKIYSAAKASIDQFESEYATIELKFDYKKRPATTAVNNSIMNLINKLVQKPERTEYFNILSVKAEDADKNDRLEYFDLLMDKLKSRVKVQKQARYRTIISADMIERMKSELTKNNI